MRQHTKGFIAARPADHPRSRRRVPQLAMPKISKPLSTSTKNLLKGALAGLVGGLIATAAKSAAERIYPPRTHGEPEPNALLAEKLGASRAETKGKKAAEESMHWAFGAVAGAAYGVMAELYPAVTAKNGATFGMALMTVTHEGAIPALGLGASPENQEPREQRSEMATHIVYGVVCETVRNVLRKAL
jgi:putative membrane protein